MFKIFSRLFRPKEHVHDWETVSLEPLGKITKHTVWVTWRRVSRCRSCFEVRVTDQGGYL